MGRVAGVAKVTLNVPSVIVFIPVAEVCGTAFNVKENVPDAPVAVRLVITIVTHPPTTETACQTDPPIVSNAFALVSLADGPMRNAPASPARTAIARTRGEVTLSTPLMERVPLEYVAVEMFTAFQEPPSILALMVPRPPVAVVIAFSWAVAVGPLVPVGT